MLPSESNGYKPGAMPYFDEDGALHVTGGYDDDEYGDYTEDDWEEDFDRDYDELRAELDEDDGGDGWREIADDLEYPE